MGSCDCPIFSVEVKSKWKACWLLCFVGLTTRKLKKNRNVQKTFTIALFDFAAFRRRILLFTSATFGCHITLWVFAPFGCSSCGRSHLEFSKLEKKNDNDTIKKMKWKNLVSWKKRSNLARDYKETNKTMAMEELLEKTR
jgi:hypothetical protein